jgi:peptidoglycan/xylan/chitin deacetylase (PgdA/CDA1 family)
MSHKDSFGHLIGAIDRLAKYSGVLRRMRRANAKGVTILMYHKILPRHLALRYPWQNLVVDTETFDRQMTWLGRHFDVMPVCDAMDLLDRGALQSGRTKRPLACVTFDDGYRDNFDHAAPILESHGLRATFFVATDFVCGVAFWFDLASIVWLEDSAEALRQAVSAAPEHCDRFAGVKTLDAWISALKRIPSESRDAVLAGSGRSDVGPAEIYGAMTSEQVRELSRRGHEIGAHSVTHRILTQLDDPTLRVELEQPRSTLFGWSGIQVEGVCFPNGDYDDRVIAAARTAGYRYGCAVTRGVAMQGEDRMALSRRAIFSSGRSATTLDFEAEVVGWHDLFRSWRRSA